MGDAVMQEADIQRIVRSTLDEMGYENIELMRISDLEKLMSCDRRTIYRLVDEKEFPKPIKLRNKKSSNHWFKGEVSRWLKKCTRN